MFSLLQQIYFFTFLTESIRQDEDEALRMHPRATSGPDRGGPQPRLGPVPGRRLRGTVQPPQRRPRPPKED